MGTTTTKPLQECTTEDVAVFVAHLGGKKKYYKVYAQEMREVAVDGQVLFDLMNNNSSINDQDILETFQTIKVSNVLHRHVLFREWQKASAPAAAPAAVFQSTGNKKTLTSGDNLDDNRKRVPVARNQEKEEDVLDSTKPPAVDVRFFCSSSNGSEDDGNNDNNKDYKSNHQKMALTRKSNQKKTGSNGGPNQNKRQRRNNHDLSCTDEVAGLPMPVPSQVASSNGMNSVKKGTLPISNTCRRGLTSLPLKIASDTRIFRIRVFAGNNRRGPDDPYARKPSLFALKNGCVFKSNNYLPIEYFPESNEYECHQISPDLFDNMTFERPLDFDRAKWNKDYMMATMPVGSIVAMIIPNRLYQSDVVFGTVQGDTFRIEHHDDLGGFPFQHGCGLKNLLYRNVSWSCRAKLRELPGQEWGANGACQVKWLLEACPACVMEVKENNKRKAFQHLQSQAFKEISTADMQMLIQEANHVL